MKKKHLGFSASFSACLPLSMLDKNYVKRKEIE
jgi:hypothetical protein